MHAYVWICPRGHCLNSPNFLTMKKYPTINFSCLVIQAQCPSLSTIFKWKFNPNYDKNVSNMQLGEVGFHLNNSLISFSTLAPKPLAKKIATTALTYRVYAYTWMYASVRHCPRTISMDWDKHIIVYVIYSNIKKTT